MTSFVHLIGYLIYHNERIFRLSPFPIPSATICLAAFATASTMIMELVQRCMPESPVFVAFRGQAITALLRRA